MERFNLELAGEHIDLTILPGCEIPLFLDIIKFFDENRLVTINDGQRYICLEMPDSIIPPATEDIIFQLNSRGITPIITHPERNPIFYEMPQKLRRFISLGCLAQITACSLIRGFGWRVSRFTKKLVREGLVHIMATDAHNVGKRPPLMGNALKKLSKLVGEGRAWDMVATTPERIIQGERAINCGGLGEGQGTPGPYPLPKTPLPTRIIINKLLICPHQLVGRGVEV